MYKRTTTLPAFVLITLLAGCGSHAAAQEGERATPRKEFPEASLTIFPVTFIITGPVDKSPAHREFYDKAKRHFAEAGSELAGHLGLLLEEKGYDKFERTNTTFRFPEGNAARKERAAAFGKFASELDLKTDYALCTEFTLHLEEGFQEVYLVIADAKGGIVWEDSQRMGDPESDKDFPGTDWKCCELACRRLTPVMGLEKLPKKELAEDKKQALRNIRGTQPPEESEVAAIDERREAMKKARTSARVMVYPTRVGGDHTEQASGTHLSELLNEAKLCEATAARTGPVLKGEGWPNEMGVLWLFARNVRDYVQEHPADSDYVLFADYWFNPRGQVWAVHFVVCDRAGEWVIVDLQNSHQEAFQRINPKNLEDCDRLVLERLKMELQ